VSTSPVELARRLELEVWGDGRLEVLDEITTPGYTVHDIGQGITIAGRDAVRAEMREFRATFALDAITIEDVVAGDGSAVVRWFARGTHALPFAGIPPTGRRVDLRGIDVFHVEGGRLAETWVACNDVDLLNQLTAS
jgi:steroid delta-isomerase-like uncharacterized protein